LSNTATLIKSRRTSWAKHVESMREIKNTHKVLVGKPQRKRHESRWQDNIIIHVREIGCGGMGYIQLVQWQAVVNSAMSLRVP